MAIAATEPTSLIAFTLPSTPYSVQMARFYIRAALTYHELYNYTEDVQTVASELVTNAVMHAGAGMFGLELLRLEGTDTVVVLVTDASPLPPAVSDPAGDADCGRGLQIVAALCARWGWTSVGPGKAVFAVFTREG